MEASAGELIENSGDKGDGNTNMKPGHKSQVFVYRLQLFQQKGV